MERVLRRVYSSRRMSVSLKIISHASVLISVAAFILVLVTSYLKEPMLALRAALAGGIPFVIVTVIRRAVNAPRPYELYSFYDVPPKNKRGQSFPSRHVFSSFTVAVLSVTVSPILTVSLAFVGLLLAMARVLLGMHFIRDVVCGALIGILSGVCGLLLIVL